MISLHTYFYFVPTVIYPVLSSAILQSSRAPYSYYIIQSNGMRYSLPARRLRCYRSQ